MHFGSFQGIRGKRNFGFILHGPGDMSKEIALVTASPMGQNVAFYVPEVLLGFMTSPTKGFGMTCMLCVVVELLPWEWHKTIIILAITIGL